MFSPYYALAQRSGQPDPRNFVAVNVALYGPRHGRWTMTERGRPALTTTENLIAIGPSKAQWDNGKLVVDIDEIAVPIPRRVRGRVTVCTPFVTDQSFALDPAGLHRWWPVCPLARVSVEMENPVLSWQGPGYLDSNEGDEPVANGFASWTWSRAHLKDGSAALLYDPIYPDGSRSNLALHVDESGSLSPFEPPPVATMKRSLWGITRETRCESGNAPRVTDTFEDTPFYARSAIETSLLGQSARAVHESLSIPRFTSPVVQMMLPFRMPRRSGG